MFSRVAVFSTLSFALLAAAGSCNTGPVQCCNSVEEVRASDFRPWSGDLGRSVALT